MKISASLSIFQSKKTFEEKQEAIIFLRETIEYHSQKYYGEDDSEISDSEFDTLISLLKEWEKSFPELVVENSPSQKVFAVQSKLEKSKHLVPMISLGNAFTHADLVDWEKRWKKIVEKQYPLFDLKNFESDETLYVVEPKFDGLGISCVYENGTLSRAVTRGDGEEGETVTKNVETIKEVQKNIITGLEKIQLDSEISDIFEVRGEIVMKKSEFYSLNERLIEQGKKEFSNPRNAAAGSLRQLNSQITAERKLSIFFYESPLAQTNQNLDLKTYSETLEFFKEKNISYCPQYFSCSTLHEVEKAIATIAQMREKFDFDIDGAVVKINSYALREKIGATGHHPRWATSWKFPASQVITTLNDVEWQVGRTGVVTPVAHLEPVNIDGVIVSRATLHNMDNIQSKDLRKGDSVLLERSGDVIPKILKPFIEKRTGEEKVIFPPENCPVCQGEIIKIEEEVALRCSNQSCPKVLQGKLKHFASKKAMNITGLGKEVCEDVIQQKLVTDISDVYFLTKEDWFTVKNFKEKSVKNITTAIEKSKSQPFWRIINALGIPLVGEKTAKTLAKKYPSFVFLQNASSEDLNETEDIGDKMKDEIPLFFTENRTLIEKLESVLQTQKKYETGLRKETENQTLEKETSDKFQNYMFVFTGKLQQFSRDEAGEMVEQNGGKTSSSLSKNTSFLVAGEKAGSKKEKAEKLGVKIVSEDEFLGMVKD